jgi:site-specific DNA-methyltransferase (adenine-specific)
MWNFYKADCLDILTNQLKDKSVDLIYIDPPFNSATRNWWDSVLDWPKLFQQIFRILKDNGTLVIHCSQPFTYELIRAAPKAPSFHYVWNKGRVSCPFIAKVQPMRCCEEILVWRNKKATYYPQRVGNEERTFKSNGGGSYYGATSEQKEQTVIGKYQRHYIEMPIIMNKKEPFGTRPEALVELIIKSFTQEGDTVLDFTCYTGISGKVSKKLGRNWIGVDKYHWPLQLFQG